MTDKQLILNGDIVNEIKENNIEIDKLVLKLVDSTAENDNTGQISLSWYEYLIQCFQNIFSKPNTFIANETVETLLTEEERKKIADLRVAAMTKKYPRHKTIPKKKSIESDALAKKYEQIVLDWCD